MNGEIQLILLFKQECDFTQVLHDAIAQAYSTVEELTVEQLADLGGLDSVDMLPSGHAIVRASLFYENFGNNSVLISDVLDALRVHDNMISVIKFYDPELREQHRQMYDEIFALEMRLREVLTYIFMHRFPDNPHSLLQYTNSAPTYPDKNLSKSIDKRRGEHSENFSNEFFYLLFSQYPALLDVKKLHEQEVANILAETESFEEFRKIILERSIQDETHKDFLLSIKEILDPIEKTRNCIMHNRNLPEILRKSYEHAKDELIVKISDFWDANNIETIVKWQEKIGTNLENAASLLTELIKLPDIQIKNILSSFVTELATKELTIRPEQYELYDAVCELSSSTCVDGASDFEVLEISIDKSIPAIYLKGEFLLEITRSYDNGNHTAPDTYPANFEMEFSAKGFALTRATADTSSFYQ